MKTTITRLGISAALAAVVSLCKELAVPFIVLCVLMTADYVTGMVKSWQKGTLCSKTGVKGFIKKLCYGMAVVAALGVDYVIVTLSETLSYKVNGGTFFAMLCTVWLIINECISILENLSEMGVPMPIFLIKISKRLKNNMEEKGNAA